MTLQSIEKKLLKNYAKRCDIHNISSMPGYNSFLLHNLRNNQYAFFRHNQQKKCDLLCLFHSNKTPTQISNDELRVGVVFFIKSDTQVTNIISQLL